MTAKIDGTNGLLQNYDYQVLTTGFSYTFAAGTQILVINPAGTLATGTITMPASPADGMTITFSSTKQITALTLSGNTGQTVVSAVTVLPANQATTYVYRLSNTTWYPMTNVATNTFTSPTLTSPTITGAVVSSMASSVITSGTAVNSTSGTSIDYTGLPSWVKRITVMFNGVSTNGASSYLIQIGNSGGIVSTGYNSTSIETNSTSGTGGTSSTAGFVIFSNSASLVNSGHIVLTNVSGSVWVSSHTLKGLTTVIHSGGGDGSVSTLDRVRITTVNGTDTFDAGSVNILYE